MASPSIIKADVLVFGAGPGGLATAGALARQLYTTIVFSDHASPSGAGFRNRRTRHMHNVPGWDHRDPAEFRAKSGEDILARYKTVEFRDVGVRSVRVLDGALVRQAKEGSAAPLDVEEQECDGVDVAVDAGAAIESASMTAGAGTRQDKDKMRFEAVDDNGVQYQARRLVVASGVRDVMPEEEIPGYTELWGRTM